MSHQLNHAGLIDLAQNLLDAQRELQKKKIAMNLAVEHHEHAKTKLKEIEIELQVQQREYHKTLVIPVTSSDIKVMDQVVIVRPISDSRTPKEAQDVSVKQLHTFN